jgi:hypothetical protein
LARVCTIQEIGHLAKVYKDMIPSISELEADDVPKVCELFQNVFGQTISTQHWRWKYQLGPRLGGLNFVAKTAGGDLLGHAGAGVFPGIMGGAPLVMAQVCDIMVARCARGAYSATTVYPRLMKTMQETLLKRYVDPYAYGFAGVRQFKLGTRLGYYRELHPYRPCYLTPAGIADARHGCWLVREMDWDIERLDKIWSRRAAEISRPTVSRSGAYLRWRYQNHPANSYQLWLLTHLWRDRGWFITRTMPSGEICIVDALLPAAADPRHQVAMLASALAKSMPVLPPIYSWLFQTAHSTSAHPVIGGEFKLEHWHNDTPRPSFQPGDTDVF